MRFQDYLKPFEIVWWRRRGSNPRPRTLPPRFLQAQFFFKFPLERKEKQKAAKR